MVVKLGPTNTEHILSASPRQSVPLATSGDLDGGTLKLQGRNHDDDAWEDNPNVSLAADEHLEGHLEVNMKQNRVFLDTPGASALVHLNVG